MTNTQRGITGSTLKIIAIVTMFLDHVGAVILELGLIPAIQLSIFSGLNYDYSSTDYMIWSSVDLLLRIIGRTAFIIFLFLLVEGFLHTSNVWKYALRLGIFALISEIPFNLALTGKVIDFNTSMSTCTLLYQNVFFTLLISLMMMILLDLISEKIVADWMIVVLQTVTVIILAIIAELLHTDYGMLGIAMAAVMYFCRNRPTQRVIFTAGVIIAYTFVASLLPEFLPQGMYVELFGLLAFIFIRLYNGERGTFKMKYFFYAFYPAHLLLLFLIRYMMFGI